MNKGLIAMTLASLLVVMTVAGCSGSTKPADQAATVPAGAHGQPPEDAGRTAPAPASQSTVTQYPLTIKDGAGRDVTIAAEPKRVISMGPEITEMVSAIGKDDLLVGRGDPDVGSANPQVDKLVALKPDLVLLTGGNDKLRDQLANDDKLTVFVVDPKSFVGVSDAMVGLGQVLNGQEKAAAAVKAIATQAQEIIGKVAKATTRPKVFFRDAGDPQMTPGREAYINDLIILAGGLNVSGDTTPDITITGKEAGDISRPGPQLVQGLQWFAEKLHPELFK